ncbi:hypothetical protein V6Z98_000134 [Aspergillus fumigatus]
MQLLIPPRPSFQPGPFFSHPNQFQPPSTSELIRDTLIQKYVPIYQALTPVLSPLRVCIDEQVRLQLHDSTLVFNSCSSEWLSRQPFCDWGNDHIPLSTESF